MPIQIGNTILRNIQEQVGKNQADINALKLAQALGFKNIGTLDEASDIPEGTYNYGEFFFIGTQAPYEVYIYTNHDGTDEFINLGTLAGPQGNIGLPGSTGTVEIVATVTGEPGSDASVVNTGTASAAKLTFTIPTGAAGPQGPVGSRGLIGPEGPEGPQGPQGIPGDPGQSFMIIGTITSEAQLPDAADTPRNYAYVYNDNDPTTPNRLYYIIGDEGEEEWSYSSFAVAGTTVYSNGYPIYTFDADTKLDKVTTSDTYARVYTIAGNGTQTLQNTSVEIIAGDSCIVRRVPATGDVKVPSTPSYNDAAASKGYVDGKTDFTIITDSTQTTLVSNDNTVLYSTTLQKGKYIVTLRASMGGFASWFNFNSKLGSTTIKGPAGSGNNGGGITQTLILDVATASTFEVNAYGYSTYDEYLDVTILKLV